MLETSLSKAFGTAERMVSLARHKAADAGLPGVLAAGDSSGFDFRSHNFAYNAANQYEENRNWVNSCVSLVAGRIAGQTIHVAKESTGPAGDSFVAKSHQLPARMKGLADQLEPVESHPLLDLLHDPWELGTAWTLMAVTVANLELTGQSLWYCAEEKGRRQILPIPSSWIYKVNRSKNIWEIRPSGTATPIPLPGDQVCYFHYPNPADPWGCLSPLQAIAGAVMADNAINETQFRTFSQGQFPGVVLTAGRLDNPPGIDGPGPRPTLTPEQRAQLVSAIRRAYSGVHKYGEPLILDGLIEDVKRFSLTPYELDFLNSAKLTKDRILQGYRVSPILLGQVEGANRASATVADEIFCGNKVNPLIMLMSQVMTQWLGPMFARGGEKLTIWIEDAVAHDPDFDFKWWSMMVARGMVDEDEVRKHRNLPARVRAAAATLPAGQLAGAPVAAPANDIQATALNGAQIDSLLKIAELVTSGELTKAAAKALIEAAFPLLLPAQIAAIVDALEAGSNPPAVDPIAAKALAARLTGMNPYTPRINGQVITAK